MFTKYNSIRVCNLPDNSRDVDLSILVSKTHILNFLRTFWIDNSTNIGHLILKKDEFIDFVLFVLQKYFNQEEDELCCNFEKEYIDVDESIITTLPSSLIIEEEYYMPVHRTRRFYSNSRMDNIIGNSRRRRRRR